MVNLNNKTNHLVLITSGFPYDNHENYLETEIIYLAKRFSKILILSHDIISKNCRSVPKNVQTKRVRYNLTFIEKLIAVRQVFNQSFKKEIKIIKNQYKIRLTIGLLKTLLISLENSKRLEIEYEKQIINLNEKNITLYSYWCNDSAIALGNLKISKGGDFKCITRMHRWDIYFEENKYGYLPLRDHIFKKFRQCVLYF